MRSREHVAGAAFAVLVISILPLDPCRADEAHVTPTPTPASSGRDAHLAEYADRHSLDRSILARPGGTLVITNETVERVGDRGTITTCRPSPAANSRAVARGMPTPSAPDPKRRTYWRNKVGAQRERVAQVTRELALLKARIDALEDAAFAGGRNATRLWARVEEAKARRKTVEALLSREKTKLDTIVRQARQEGAQPGWFR
jgi:hypothetical protein